MCSDFFAISRARMQINTTTSMLPRRTRRIRHLLAIRVGDCSLSFPFSCIASKYPFVTDSDSRSCLGLVLGAFPSYAAYASAAGPAMGYAASGYAAVAPPASGTATAVGAPSYDAYAAYYPTYATGPAAY